MTELTTTDEALHKQISCSQVQNLMQVVKKARDRNKELWQTNCQQNLVHHKLMFEKEMKMKHL